MVARMAAATTLLHRALPWVTTAARLVLSGVFGYSGMHKVLYPADSVVTVDAYQLLPESLVDPVAYGQPIIELSLAVLLLLGLGTRIVSGATALLLVVFIAAVASAWARGLTIDCGCFGGGGSVAEDETSYLRVIVRDIGLIALAAWAMILPPGRFAVDTWLRPRLSGGYEGR